MSTLPKANAGWLEQALEWSGFKKKFLSKAFPVHPSFFIGEIALFSFIVLVITGVYLLFSYEPSARLITVGGQSVPAAYDSVLKIGQQPFGLIVQRVHHWSAHLMIAAAILHLLRVFFSGTFHKPRQLNWVIGCMLLFASIFASFSGYLLPYDEFAVTATGIGYGIARSVPWVGPAIADFVFAGKFPALGTIPRFFGYHVALLPLALMGLLALHFVVMIKQKHTEPAYNRGRVEPGKLLGIPLWPQQAALMFQLFLLMTAGVLLLAAFFPVHPVEVYGPPVPETPNVKPDWYFLWVYGLLKLIPGWIEIHLPGATINAEVIGGILLPGLFVLLVVCVPFLHREREPQHYMQPLSQRPLRSALGVAVLVMLLWLSLAGYADVLRWPLELLTLGAVAIPLAVGLLVYLMVRRKRVVEPQDPVGGSMGAATAAPLGKE